MARLKVDRHVPAPTHSPNTKYYFRDLTPGDSRFYPSEPPGKVQSAATSFGTYAGMKFRTQRVVEKGKLGLRVWRVS